MKDRLKALMDHYGLSQTQFAKQLGLHVSNVNAWVKGREAIPRARLDSICLKFNVRREWLENGDGEMFEPEKDPEKEKEKRYKEAFATIYENLPESFQRMFREIVAEKFNVRMEEDEPAATEKKPARSKSKTQTNNGTVHGDMVQN